ncbi:MAG: DUF4411 family protein [Anaerolineaceae bacterium]|nr:DUF4411 family protein [Anaerolineaceae bacterium]
MAYLLDANVFIHAQNAHYGFDFCPAFWDWLVRENAARRLYSVDQVKRELMHEEKDDLLRQWAKERGRGFFLPPDATTTASFPVISEWVRAQRLSGRYTEAAESDFFDAADFYLVAHAYTDKHTIVTHEGPTDSRNIIRIPDVCAGLNLTCISPYEMLRSAGARFVLGMT